MSLLDGESDIAYTKPKNTILFLLAYSLVSISTRLPFYGQVKAFYVLAAGAPLALCFGEGTAWVLDRLRSMNGFAGEALSALLLGYLGTLAFVLVASYLG